MPVDRGSGGGAASQPRTRGSAGPPVQARSRAERGEEQATGQARPALGGRRPPRATAWWRSLLARVALWLWLLGILIAFALAGGEFAIDLGLFALFYCVVEM